MSSLDEKLMDALKTVLRDGEYISRKQFLIYITELIDPEHNQDGPMALRIRQAARNVRQSFIDDGWVKLRNHDEGEKCYTGQEWFNRFDEELNRYEGHYHKWMGPLSDEVREAAKKAAGIE